MSVPGSLFSWTLNPKHSSSSASFLTTMIYIADECAGVAAELDQSQADLEVATRERDTASGQLQDLRADHAELETALASTRYAYDVQLDIHLMRKKRRDRIFFTEVNDRQTGRET